MLHIFVGVLLTLKIITGGALKPADVDPLWVHVTCAWFQPQVAFANGEKMEPARGILNISPDSFFEVYQ